MKSENSRHKFLTVTAEDVRNLFVYRISIPHFLDPEYQGNYRFTFEAEDDSSGKKFFDYPVILSWLNAALKGEVSREEFLVFIYILSKIEKTKDFPAYVPDGENLFDMNYLSLIFNGFRFDPSCRIVKKGFFDEEEYWPEYKNSVTQEQYDQTFASIVREAVSSLERYQKNDSLPLEEKGLTTDELQMIYGELRAMQSFPPSPLQKKIGHFCLEKLRDRDFPEIDADLGQEYACYEPDENGLSAFGYKQDSAKALYYLKKSQADTACGYIYLNGAPNVKKDYDEAFKYFYLGAHGKDLEANYKLADLYAEGKGMKKDPKRAERILLSGFPRVLSFASLNNPWYLAQYAKRLRLYARTPFAKYAFSLLSYWSFKTRIEQDQHGWDDVQEMKNLAREMKDYRLNVLGLKGRKPALHKDVPLPYELNGDEISLWDKGAFLYPYLPSKFVLERTVLKDQKEILAAWVPSKRKNSLLMLALPRTDTILMKRKFVFRFTLSEPFEEDLKEGTNVRLSGKNVSVFLNGKASVRTLESAALVSYEEADYQRFPEPLIINSLPDESYPYGEDGRKEQPL